VEGARLFRLAAEQGDANAQTALSTSYMNGDGVARDFAASMLWARRAADQGSASGEHNVGALYLNGLGVSRDYRAAVPWFERAAKQGVEPSKAALRDLAAEGVPEAAAAVLHLHL